MASSPRDRCDELLRELAPQTLSAIGRRFRDFAAAEDAVQEALLAAAMQWPTQGIPDNPRGWLVSVASRRMIDHWRSDEARRRVEEGVASEPTAAPDEAPDGTQIDDTLELFFTCCHPSLTPVSAIALTLRAVGGLTTAEIARAFLVPETTMAQRISRAKQSLRVLASPFQPPDAHERAGRLRAVLHVLYLLFNEGYTSIDGPHIQRSDLSREAIRLARSVHSLVPGDAEAAGLLALMLLTDARRHARTGTDGELIPLTKQKRNLWDRSKIAEGVALLTSTLSRGSIGAYQLQAAIAAVHSEAVRPEDTDWPQILALYELLKRMSDNPMVSLSHAVAVAMVHGPSKGLELLSKLDSDPRLADHYRLHAVRGHLLEESGDHGGAIGEYRIAANKTTSTPERNYLLTQAARLGDASASPEKLDAE